MDRSIATVGGAGSAILLVSADADADAIAAGDFVENAVYHGGSPKYTVRGTEAVSMSLLLRNGETDVRKVFNELRTAAENARSTLLSEK